MHLLYRPHLGVWRASPPTTLSTIEHGVVLFSTLNLRYRRILAFFPHSYCHHPPSNTKPEFYWDSLQFWSLWRLTLKLKRVHFMSLTCNFMWLSKWWQLKLEFSFIHQEFINSINEANESALESVNNQKNLFHWILLAPNKQKLEIWNNKRCGQAHHCLCGPLAVKTYIISDGFL